MTRPKTKTTKPDRKPWVKTRKPKPTRKPVRRDHCPECGHQEFSVTPYVVPEILYRFLDNGDTVVTLEDYMRDDSDEVRCANCGWEGNWPDVERGKPLIEIL